MSLIPLSQHLVTQSPKHPIVPNSHYLCPFTPLDLSPHLPIFQMSHPQVSSSSLALSPCHPNVPSSHHPIFPKPHCPITTSAITSSSLYSITLHPHCSIFPSSQLSIVCPPPYTEPVEPMASGAHMTSKLERPLNTLSLQVSSPFRKLILADNGLAAVSA